ncbi:hypothetical protein [Brevundimonas sp. Bb-A]|jgi:hypothetical protein|uniref:hypothetical protein n=1 Tax=Brevundimonas sp. Bb-A TaxID=2560058 RepID=UPI00128EB3A9|nr:hypothetical protein [Brevundimonas sp. Bb-A]QFU31493.1 hypothetical protein BSP_07455 [Brevundimonas sp. Bb-A]
MTDILTRITAMVGDLARPLAIIASSFAAAWATVVIAYRVENGNDGAIFIGAVFAGVGALYIGKAWEIAKTGKQSAEVEIAKTQATERQG